MTLHTPAPRHHLPLQTTPDDTVAPTFILEAILSGPVSQPIDLPGWTIRVWPVARLGDVTLEARASDPSQRAADLGMALNRAGIVPLGPIRARSTGLG
ncbi:MULTISPECIES: hypothetical protein [Deinococcus]|uniref:Uncharacterized protein n=1 Tax=Deinococcus rufus TaxID=2136097 RepID=A0ABV7Z8H8_9DEIO|nr:hypothetical protein [Deinococcus sp. AB2017081]WQE94597.1 hypothetical protein U2P90_14455 [Deinococcus sp. AB2017081]